MALQNTFVVWPDTTLLASVAGSTGSPLFSTSANYQLNATNTKVAVKMPVTKSGNITGVTFTLQAAATSQSIRVSIQTLDTSGNPTGTYYKGSNYVDYASTLTANILTDVTLGTQCTAAVVGDWVAIVFEWTSTQGDIRIASTGSGFAPIAKYTGTWSWNNGRGIVGFVYDDASYAGSVPLINTNTAHTYNQSTSGADEYGIKIPIPFKCRAVGAWTTGYPIGTSSNMIAFTLYNGTTMVASSVFDPDVMLANTLGSISLLYFASPVVLTPGQTYYLGLSPESTSANITLQGSTVASNAQFATWPGGVGVYSVKRLNGVTWSSGVPSYSAVGWTETTTENHAIGLVLDQLDDGAGSGGIFTNSDMNGGFQ